MALIKEQAGLEIACNVLIGFFRHFNSLLHRYINGASKPEQRISSSSDILRLQRVRGAMSLAEDGSADTPA